MFFCRAFCSEEFLGNPAAISIVEEFPSDMQDIAKNLNFSETAFVKHVGKNNFLIRWFSPLDEAPLCGHATLASTFVLHKTYGLSKISFIYRYGHILAEVKNHQVHIFLPKKKVMKVMMTELQADALKGFHVKNVYTDNMIDIFHLDSEEAVLSFKPDFEVIKKISKRAFVLTASSKKFDFVARYFAPNVGINEDPFCGSVHCRLVSLWGSIKNKKELTSYQSGGAGIFIEHENSIEMIGKVNIDEKLKQRLTA